MSNRTVSLQIDAKVTGLMSGLRTAQKATSDYARDLEGWRKKNEAHLDTIGNSAGKAGLAAAAGLAMVGKAAIDWESAWTGVTKTVNGTPEQLAAVEDGLRGLARELPSSHAEIAGVAEAAGQLGVATGDVVGFTKTMIDLGETTNLTADEAATNIAQISNVMGTMEREGSKGVERFGAALVALGNDGASTEAEILSMSQRIAGAGATLGASEADVLALSNTLASMGVNAELGGGVTTRVLLKMRSAVDAGGESLEAFAKVAGVSADDFASKFREAPVEALDLVSKGIHGVNEAGGNVTATLREMGIKGTEETQVMLALANSGDLLTDSLELGAEAWANNTALVEEANKRYATTEAQVRMAWNSITDAAIEAGAVILPMVASMADAVGNLADWFGSLPPAVQGFLTVLGGVGAAAGLGVAGVISISKRVGELRESLTALHGSGGRAGSSLKNLGKIATAAAVGVGTFTTAIQLFNTGLAEAKGPGHFANELEKISSGISDVDSLFTNLDFGEAKAMEDQIRGLGDALDELNGGGLQHFGADLGARNGVAILREQVEGLDGALASAVSSGNAEKAAVAWEQITAEAELQGMSLEKLNSLFPQYADSLSQVEAESRNASASSSEVKAALDEVGVSTEGVISDMETYLDLLFETGLLTMSSRDAQAAYETQLDSVDAAVKELSESGGKMGAVLNKNKSDFDLSSEAGRLANTEFQALARGGMDEVRAMSEEGVGQDELQAKLSATYDDLVAAGKAFGMTAGDAEGLAREVLGIPDDVKVDSWMSSEAKRTAEQTKAAVDSVNGSTAHVWITTHKKSIYSESHVSNGRGGSGGQTLAQGGRARLGSFSGGGRLPATGLGTDMILGVTSSGRPIANVDDREWVINRQSSDKYDAELTAINAGTFPKLPGYADGGQLTVPPAHVSSAQGSGQTVSLNQESIQMMDSFIQRAEQVSGRPINVKMNVDGRKFGEAMTYVTNQYIKRR